MIVAMVMIVILLKSSIGAFYQDQQFLIKQTNIICQFNISIFICKKYVSFLYVKGLLKSTFNFDM